MNRIIHGDSIKWLPTIPDSSIDMIYIDPPFFTQKDWGDYSDKWVGMDAYLQFMKERLVHAHRVLNETGSIFLHCDYRANYKLRYLLDDIFGGDNFKNEIIWSYRRWSSKVKFLQRNHHTILWYEKELHKGTFNLLMMPKAKNTLKKFKSKKISSKIDKESGKRKLIYFDEISKDTPLNDVWSICHMSPVSKERTGYATQKPVALLKRIIKCSTNENNTVLDFFCGSGTTAVAASNLNRRFIVGDINIKACEITKDRLINESPLFFQELEITHNT